MKINGKQNVKLRSGLIKIKNHFKKFVAPFKICVDFECNVNDVQGNNRENNTVYNKNYQDHIPCGFAYKILCIDEKFSKKVVSTEEKMQLIDSLKESWKNMNIVKR